MNKDKKHSKYKIAKDILEELEDFESYIDLYEEDNISYLCLPYRKSDTYVNIEEMIKEDFISWIIFFMAIRNKKVKEIIKKLETIFNIFIEQKQRFKNMNVGFDVDNILELNDLLYAIWGIEYKPRTIKEEKLRNKCISIMIDSAFEDFEYRLKSFLTNEKVCEYYIFENLLLLFEKLNEKLKKDFLIFPDGYNSSVCAEEAVVSKKDIKLYMSSQSKKTEFNYILEEFRKFKNTDMKSVADLFFIYDYYRYNLDEYNKNYLIKNIKYALTKCHGIIKQGTSEIIPYKEFLENYNNGENNKEKFFGYYLTDRSIRSKILMMQKFIDECNYKYLFFN